MNDKKSNIINTIVKYYIKSTNNFIFAWLTLLFYIKIRKFIQLIAESKKLLGNRLLIFFSESKSAMNDERRRRWKANCIGSIVSSVCKNRTGTAQFNRSVLGEELHRAGAGGSADCLSVHLTVERARMRETWANLTFRWRRWISNAHGRNRIWSSLGYWSRVIRQMLQQLHSPSCRNRRQPCW